MKVLCILSVRIILLLIFASTATGVEVMNSRTPKTSPQMVSKPHAEQREKQKRPIQIRKADFRKLVIKILTVDELKAMRDLIDSKYETFQHSSIHLWGQYRDYNYLLKICSNKSYTYQEQQAAGCQPGDTIQQCSEKLLVDCVGNKGMKLKEDSDKVQDDLRVLINHLENLTNRLKGLSNELQKKYQ